MREMEQELEFPIDYFCDEIRDGFFVSETIKRHWAALLRVLGEIDRICKRHDIKWFADSGTLLGAIRHKGFIPWDDDIDIAMFRDDFELFLSFAKDELPEGYYISYPDERFANNPSITQNYPFCGIINSSQIRNDKAYLDEFYHFPIPVSVDIFPLDRIYNDPEKEANRKMRGFLVYGTYMGLLDDEFSEDEISALIPIIENQNNVSLGDEDIKRKLLSLFIEISKECKDEKSTDVAIMYLWVKEGKARYKRKYYDTWSEYEFETTKIRVPCCYHEILTIFYGEYMKVVKGRSDHAYPAWGEYEAIYRKNFGKNPLRYTFEKGKFIPITKKKLHQRLRELFSLIHNLHVHIQESVEAENYDAAVSLLQNCQDAAVVIGNVLEDKFGNETDMVTLLEQYCEAVYRASNMWNDNSRLILDGFIDNVEKRVDESFKNRKRDILILLCKASWWSSIQEVFEMISDDIRNTISVIPIPYCYFEHRKMFGEMIRDSEAFNNISELSGNITNFDEYDLEKRHPDMIIIQFPYDDSSSTLGIPEMLYSNNLRQYTDRLVFVPFLNPDPPESDDDVATKAMEEMVEQPAVFNSDMIIIGSEKLRDYYIKTLVGMTDKELKSYWEKRICLKEELNNWG